MIITDFKVGVGGDVLDYSDLLRRNGTLSYDGTNPFGNGLLSLEQVGADTLLKFDADGASGTAESAVVVARLQNVVASTLVANNFNPNYPTDGSPAVGQTLNGNSQNEQLLGEFGNDTINGLGGNDTIDGQAGSDLIDGGAGNDTIYGGDGNDTLSDDQGSNLLEGGAGNDRLRSSSLSGQHTLLGGVGNDNLSATGLVASLDGGDGDDSLVARGYLNQSGSRGYVKDGTATLQGGLGNDNLYVDQYTSSTLSGGDGNDFLSVTGGWESYQTYGTVPVTSSLQGDAGNDYLNAYCLSSASLVGGEGSDNLSVSDSRLANLNGGADNDTLNVNFDSSISYYTDGASWLSNSYSLDGGEGDDNLSVSGNAHFGDGQVTVALEGGLGNDTLTVTERYAGTDNGGQNYGIASASLDGGDGDDRLQVGGVLQATLTGGVGVDTFVFTAQQYLTLLEGPRFFQNSDNTTAEITADPVIITDFKAGVGGDVLDYSDLFRNGTLSYDDTNPFGNGFLSLEQEGADTLLKSGGSVIVRLQNVVANTLVANNFNPNYSTDGSPAENLLLNGTSLNEQLVGGFGNDTINGSGGNDTIDGQVGSDLIDGGAGDDQLVGNLGGAGNDNLSSSSLSGQHTLLGDVGNDALSAMGLVVSLDGGEGDDSLYVTGQLNQSGSTSYVKDGTATLQGGLGNDNLYVDQYTSSTLSGGDGNDSLSVNGGWSREVGGNG